MEQRTTKEFTKCFHLRNKWTRISFARHFLLVPWKMAVIPLCKMLCSFSIWERCVLGLSDNTVNVLPLRFGRQVQNIWYFIQLLVFSIFTASRRPEWLHIVCADGFCLSATSAESQSTKMSIKLNLNSFVHLKKTHFVTKNVAKWKQLYRRFHSCSGICYNFDLQYCRRMTFM